MGRIAEALKRAQRERARRLRGEPGEAEASPAEAGARGEVQDPPQPVADVLSQESLLQRPAPRLPLPIHASPILPEAVAADVVAFHQPTSETAEKYRSIRTRLITSNPDGGARALAITSSLPKEGKTVTTANLGFSLAELRHLRIAIVDLELRRGGLSRLFGVSDKPGAADLLRSDKPLAEVCIPVVRENLFLIPAGQLGDSSPSELLTDPRVSKMIRELNERFHYTLIDTPPVNTVADVGMIAPLCHSVIMVVRMNRTPEPLLCRSVKMLQANHVSIAGCVLAGCTDTGATLADSHDYYDTES